MLSPFHTKIASATMVTLILRSVTLGVSPKDTIGKKRGEESGQVPLASLVEPLRREGGIPLYFELAVVYYVMVNMLSEALVPSL